MKIVIITVLALSVFLVAAEEKKPVKKTTKRGILNEGYGLGTGELSIGNGIGLYSGYGIANQGQIAEGISLGSSHGPIANVDGHGGAASLALEDQTAGLSASSAGLAYQGSAGLSLQNSAGLSLQNSAGLALGGGSIGLSGPIISGSALSSGSLLNAGSISAASYGGNSLALGGGISGISGAGLSASGLGLSAARTVHLGSSAHQTVQVNRHIHVVNRLGQIIPQPYPVQVTRNIPVPVPQPIPVKVDKPYEVRIPKPYPVPEIREIPYEVINKIPHPVPVPYKVQEIVPYPVAVPRPVPVKVPRPVPVAIPEPVAVYKRVPYLVRQVHAHVHQPPPHIHYHV